MQARIKTKEHGFWLDSLNRRTFLDSLGKKLKIKQPADWGQVTCKKIIDLDGGSILKVFKGSVYKLLESTYTGTSFRNFLLIMRTGME